MPADSGQVTSLVERPGVDGNPRYSPDGQVIAFESMGGEKIWSFRFDVWTMPAEGGPPKKLSHTPNRLTGIVEWAQDGESLLATDAHHMSTHIYEIPVDADKVTQLSTGDGLYSDASYSSSADRLAFVYQNSSKAPEVHLSSKNNFSRQQISQRNADKPKPAMGKTELITWTAPDGTTIEGLLTYPVGYNKNDQVPLILDIHGGPQGVHNHSFIRNILISQYFAEHGYATLRPNPRGSIGYGFDFRSAIDGNWGVGDIQDQLSGVDNLIKQRVVHPDSLAIWGPSYGGYMTAYMITQTDRFKAAMMAAAGTNLISDIGTTDIPDWQIAQMGGPYWDNLRSLY
ncbi:MAG: prolyl oligopeptidase family serine peptidase [Balneolaceae bacterium]|nr:prolyl oligopeptidase family serine peptidase [Balneolaceae bacterium]